MQDFRLPISGWIQSHELVLLLVQKLGLVKNTTPALLLELANAEGDSSWKVILQPLKGYISSRFPAPTTILIQ